MILDLSYRYKLVEVDYPPVNDSTTNKAAPLASMRELGRVLPCINQALATTPVNSTTPFLFAKFHIKGSFWPMVVPKDNKYKFAYVPPPPHPNCLVRKLLTPKLSSPLHSK